MQATNISADRTTPGSEDLLPFHRRYHAHSPEAGRNDSREVLVSAAMPHSSPNSIQGTSPSLSSKSSVTQKMIAKSKAAKLVSHTQRVHQYMTGGISAHRQEVQTASLSVKHRFAIRKIGIHVRAEQKLFMVSRTRAERRV